MPMPTLLALLLVAGASACAEPETGPVQEPGAQRTAQDQTAQERVASDAAQVASVGVGSGERDGTEETVQVPPRREPGRIGE